MGSIEKYLEKKLSAGVKKQGGISLKFYCVSFTGMPDRIILLPGGVILFVELKDVSAGCSPRQKVVHRFLKNLGFWVEIVNTHEKLEVLLQDIEKRII